MLKNYLLMAWNVAQRRKLFTAINLACIVITLVVLMVVTALLQEAFYPTGVEHRSNRFLEVYMIDATNTKATANSTSPLGYKVIDKYLKPMPGLEAVSAVSGVQPASVIKDGSIMGLLDLPGPGAIQVGRQPLHSFEDKHLARLRTDAFRFLLQSCNLINRRRLLVNAVRPIPFGRRAGSVPPR